jgi:hypothetical protein
MEDRTMSRPEINRELSFSERKIKRDFASFLPPRSLSTLGWRRKNAAEVRYQEIPPRARHRELLPKSARLALHFQGKNEDAPLQHRNEVGKEKKNKSNLGETEPRSHLSTEAAREGRIPDENLNPREGGSGIGFKAERPTGRDGVSDPAVTR